MARKRRVFGGAFKAKVALAAVKGDKSTAELAAKFGVHTHQVTSWKKQLLEGAADLFVDGRRKQKQSEPDQEELYAPDRSTEDGSRVAEKKICRARLGRSDDGSIQTAA